MARIYYQHKALLGSLNQNIFGMMDLYFFKEVFKKSKALLSGGQTVQFELKNSNDLPFFKHLTVWKGDFEWNGVFLPDTILLSDIANPDYSDEYYFVARIDNKLDFRKVNKNSANDWKTSVNNSVSLENVKAENPALWNKLETSFFLIFSTLENLSAEKKEHSKKTLNKPVTNSSIQKKDPTDILTAFKRLSELSGWTYQETKDFLNYLKPQNLTEENPYKLLSLSEDYYYHIQKEHKLLFMYFDWKEDIGEFLWKLNKILNNNFGIIEDIPMGNYTEENQISEDGVLEYFDNFLRIRQLQLTYIESDGDDYLFIVHRIKDFQEIKSLIATIGWDVSEI